jgi:aerobic carbon-monoxide dehydrogenase medium subunit
VRRFEMILPGSVKDVVQALAQHDGAAKLVAGGTDLLPQLKNHLLKPAVVVDLSGVAPLRQLTQEGGGLRIGAAVTARELERDRRLQSSAYRGLAESGALIGSVQVRHLATVGGNICNAAPSADMIPPLLALDAAAVIAGPGGERTVPLSDFITGVRKTVLGQDELLVALLVADPGAQSGGAYLRHTPRRELDIAVVGVGSQVTLANGVCRKARIALAAVAPTPVHATAAERALEGQALTAQKIEEAAALAVEAARPISDQRGSAEFRRHLVRILTRRTLTTALARANGAQA